jgi:uncharacterized protein YndB with AHSA1/START domain
MATVTRSQRGARFEEVWGPVSAPERRPAWWPRVTRVEEASEQGWTGGPTSSRGRRAAAARQVGEALDGLEAAVEA